MGMVACRKLGTQHCRLEDLRGALREDSMTNSLLDLSVVICTRNRAAQLTETLKRVSAVRSQLNRELIIVDNDSDARNALGQVVYADKIQTTGSSAKRNINLNVWPFLLIFFSILEI